jgi:Tol biopolymer transport system component
MNSKMSKKVYFPIVLALLASVVGQAKADFVFGTPTNLGPTINTSVLDITVNIAPDGLSLYFTSDRPGGYGGFDIWVSTRTTIDDPWGEPENLGPLVNSSAFDFAPNISFDGLTLYFNSDRAGGLGGQDIYVTTRSTKDAPWEEPVNLGAVINSSNNDISPNISADGLELFFSSNKTGGKGRDDIYVSKRVSIDEPWGEPINLSFNNSAIEGYPSISSDGLSLYFSGFRTGSGSKGSGDIWISTRMTKDDDWSEPVNLGSPVNSSYNEGSPSITAAGTSLYYYSNRSGGYGDVDLWQVAINPIVDFNGDGIVDSADMVIIVDNWGTDNSLCDIGPMPWGDGIVDVQDMIVLAEHLFEEIPPAE